VPSHRVHLYLDRKLFGKTYWRIHREMDKPYLFFGRTHRIFFHDPVSAVAIARKHYKGDAFAQQAALLHIFIDRACSSNPRFKAELQFLADLDAKERARLRKRGENKRKKRRRARRTRAERKAARAIDPLEKFDVFLQRAKQITELAYELSR
jgi:hypothetical protein